MSREALFSITPEFAAKMLVQMRLWAGSKVRDSRTGKLFKVTEIIAKDDRIHLRWMSELPEIELAEVDEKPLVEFYREFTANPSPWKRV